MMGLNEMALFLSKKKKNDGDRPHTSCEQKGIIINV